MRIIGLLSWYNERPSWLAATVASAAPHIDHIVAVDGAYMLYPGGKPHSSTEQAEAVRQTARACGIGCTIHEPQTVWTQNEVQKRSAMFRLGEAVASPNEDWYFVLDGDEIVTDCYCDLRQTLTDTDLDAGTVTFWDDRDHQAPDERPFVTGFTSEQPIRVLFRAIPGLKVEGKHYCYVTPDGRYLWGDEPCELALDVPLRIEHRSTKRDLWRQKESKDYYATRDELNIEGTAYQPPTVQG